MRKFLAVLCLALASCSLKIPHNAVVKVNLGTVITSLGNGTGFAVTDSLVVTAAHVCTPLLTTMKELKLYDDIGTKFKIVRLDVDKDLCLLKSDRPLRDHLNIAADSPSIDDEVIMVGYPLGSPQQIVTRGTYAGKIALAPNVTRYMLSCPGFGGNSGGPILNEDGEVIGVLVAGVTSYPQMTFAVTIDDLKAFLTGRS